MHKQSRQQYRSGVCARCGLVRPIAVELRSCDQCCGAAKLYRARHNERGLCGSCGRPVVAGKTKCAAHLNAHRLYEHKLKEKHRQAGLCKTCQRPIAPGELGGRCEYHKYKHMMYERKRKATRRQQRRMSENTVSQTAVA